MIFKSVSFRNYRAFGDRGARIPLDEEFVALIGVNNSGKSSILRAFYELRPTFIVLSQTMHYSLVSSLFADVRNVIGMPSVTLGQGERLTSYKRDGVMPRVTFELQAGHALSELTLILDGSMLVRCEVVLADGRHSDARMIEPGGDINAIKVPIEGGDEVVVPWKEVAQSMDFLSRAAYVPAFRNALSLGGGDYYDLEVGARLLTRFHELKNGSDSDWGDRIVSMTEGLRRIFEFQSLEINVDVSQDHFIFIVDGIQRRQNEVGAGLAQFVILAVSVLVRRPTLLLLDEPELNLHARLQLEFLILLAGFSGSQIIFATHSLGLARSAADQILVSDRNSDGDCYLEPYAAKASLASTLGSMGYGGISDTAFSAILLVEGVSDVRTFRELLNTFGVRGEVVILPLGGNELASGGKAQELAELARLSENTFVIVDSERTVAGGPALEQRQAFERDCLALGFDVLLTERRATENYLDQSLARKISGDPTAAEFGFYQRPRDVGLSWRKANNWRIAKEMSRDDLSKTDLGQFLSRIEAHVSKARS